jgi:diaphanous 1
MDVRTSSKEGDDLLRKEAEALRAQVEELSDEVCFFFFPWTHLLISSKRTKLRNELNEQIAEITTLKALPLSISGPKSPGKGEQGFHGVVQRLVQKEKQVLQLQAEVDRYKAERPAAETRDAVSRHFSVRKDFCSVTRCVGREGET